MKELSSNNPFYISEDRRLELEHFCKQYDTWFRAREGLFGLQKHPEKLNSYFDTNELGDPTARCAMGIARYSKWIDMIDDSLKEACNDVEDLVPYLMMAVTGGVSYDFISNNVLAFQGEVMPVSRKAFYWILRKFYWILSEKRE